MEDKSFVLEFIETYRSLPALWNIKSKEYSDRNIKNAQYEVLTKKYQEKYPEGTKKEITQKLNTLRTAYRRESKRIADLERSGAGFGEENESTLYYFEAMSFLRDNEQPCPSRSSMFKEKQIPENEIPNKRKKHDQSDEFLAIAAKHLMKPPDEFQKIVEPWAFKLQKMDESQRIFAEKFISEILFEGQMGTLHRNSMQLNTTSHVSSPQSTISNFSVFAKALPKTSSLVRLAPHQISPHFSYIPTNTSSSIQTPSPHNSSPSFYSDERTTSSTVQVPMLTPRNAKIIYSGPSSSMERSDISSENGCREIDSDDFIGDAAHYFSTFE